MSRASDFYVPRVFWPQCELIFKFNVLPQSCQLFIGVDKQRRSEGQLFCKQMKFQLGRPWFGNVEAGQSGILDEQLSALQQITG